MPLDISLLKPAVLKTLVYSDIFDYPLRLDELHRYLTISASVEELTEYLDRADCVESRDGYYFLAGRSELVDIRKQRETVSRKAFIRAMFYGRILGSLPFVRMVALTGSLAMLNLSKNPDMDFMLVTAHGHVWTARAFAILFGKITHLFGDTICPNLIISERALEWPLHDLYSARELCQMIPVTGHDLYLHLFAANTWTKSLLPNANPKTCQGHKTLNRGEFILRGTLGREFETWEMTRKIARFSKQAGFGAETIFTADVCQGNFHHHRKWTDEIYQERLFALGFPLPLGEGRVREK
ncbi:MAG: hypothetical protein HOP27_05000 [Anaerolineales bacterium]|nr:hypothetical protein [Anaerolineales bacterium]